MNKENGDFPPDGPLTNDCDQLRFDSILNSVAPEMLTRLEEGVILGIRRELERGHILAFCYLENERAGTLTGPSLPDLISCLKRGRRFEARVIQLDGALVRVTVKPA